MSASELSRAKAQIATQKRRGAELETVIVRKAVITFTSALTGFAESKGLQASYWNVPTKLGLGLLGSLGEALMRDATSRKFLGAFSDSQLANYAYAASKGHTFIAGGGPI
jgi:hypothetical protein